MRPSAVSDIKAFVPARSTSTSGHAAKWTTIIAGAAGALKMKLFRKKLKKQDEKDLAEASDLATRKLEQYFADRRGSPPVTSDAPKKSALTRLRWW